MIRRYPVAVVLNFAGLVAALLSLVGIWGQVLTKDQIPHKRHQILVCRGYSFLSIKVVGPYQRIAEVPGVAGKELIGNGVAKTVVFCYGTFGIIRTLGLFRKCQGLY